MWREQRWAILCIMSHVINIKGFYVTANAAWSSYLADDMNTLHVIAPSIEMSTAHADIQRHGTFGGVVLVTLTFTFWPQAKQNDVPSGGTTKRRPLADTAPFRCILILIGRGLLRKYHILCYLQA